MRFDKSYYFSSHQEIHPGKKKSRVDNFPNSLHCRLAVTRPSPSPNYPPWRLSRLVPQLPSTFSKLCVEDVNKSNPGANIRQMLLRFNVAKSTHVRNRSAPRRPLRFRIIPHSHGRRPRKQHCPWLGWPPLHSAAWRDCFPRFVTSVFGMTY